MKSQSIQSPEGVKLLMENIWLRHKAGLKQRANNVFMVELPPPTPGELAQMRGEKSMMNWMTRHPCIAESCRYGSCLYDR